MTPSHMQVDIAFHLEWGHTSGKMHVTTLQRKLRSGWEHKYSLHWYAFGKAVSGQDILRELHYDASYVVVGGTHM